MLAYAMLPLVLSAGSGLSIDAAVLATQDPPVAIRLDKNGEYDPGHDAQVNIETNLDGFLLVIHADPQGRLRVLFPLEPYDDAFVEGGQRYELVNRGGRGAFYVSETEGYGTVFAALSEWPFHVTGFAKDHRWDYERLWISPEGDVEAAFVDLVSRMAYDGWFDYDMVEYEVYGDASYASEGPAYGVNVYPTYVCCGPTFGASIWIGDPYYPYYGPPYVFASHYYRPYWYPSYYYHRPYRARYRSYASRFNRGRYYGGTRYADRGRYQFKPQYRPDRGGRDNPYRPRGAGNDGGRYASGGGSIDYRGRRTTPVNRRATPQDRRTSNPVATGGGRRASPSDRPGRTTGRVPSSGPTGRTDRPDVGRRTPTSSPSGPTGRTGRPDVGRRTPTGRPSGGTLRRTSGQTNERVRPETPRRSGTRAGAPGRRSTGSSGQGGRRERVSPAPNRTGSRQPTLTRRQPTNTTVGGRRPSVGRSTPSSRGSARPSPSRSTVRQPSRPSPSRARPSGGGTRRSTARAPSRPSTRSKSARRPR